MTDGEKRRLRIFGYYSRNLHLLETQNLLPDFPLHFDRTYICPICLEQFSDFSLDTSLSNFLTLEDVPPVSLGGKADILTCKVCNNFCGTAFDAHLTQALNQYDQRRFLPNTNFPVEIEYSGYNVQGTINVLADRTIQVSHSAKRNHPVKLKDYIDFIEPNQSVFLILKKKPAEKKMVSVALLKVAYLSAFKHYGYQLIFDPVFDDIRKQLKRPTENIYPEEYWFLPNFPDYATGVPFIIEEGKRAIMSIFYLRTAASTTQIAVLLPLPGNNLSSSYKELQNTFKNRKQYILEMRAFKSEDCLFKPVNFKDELLKYR